MDDINRTEAGNEETARRENDSWIKRHFNYECYMTFLNGCYSCKWEAQRREKPRRPLCCCSLRERIFYPWLIMSFFLSVILLFTWVETSNEYNGFDWVVFLGSRIWFFWSLVLLSVLGILAAYTTMLVVFGFLLCWEKNELYLHWYHKVFAPYIHLSSISAMVLLSWPVAFYLIHLEGEVLQVVVGLPFLLILLCLYVVPFGTYSPCVQEKDKLAPKPDFFGHRGAPMLGPENTIMSFEKAVEQGAHGLESDVQISLDEVPFLMHDYDLRRTTNILEVMPNASDEQSSFFYWDFLSTLNAGKWFADSWIIWLPGSERNYVRSKAPGFQHIGRLFTIERLTKEKITRINVDYKNLFYDGLKEYKAANININIYLVNEPWLFSLAWCSSIHSVTTDNIQVLKEINHPYYFMTPDFYMFMWIFLDIISAVFIVAIFYSIWHSEKDWKLSVEGSSKEQSPGPQRTGEEAGKGIAVDIFGSGIQDQDREAATLIGAECAFCGSSCDYVGSWRKLLRSWNSGLESRLCI
ncbi:hypothetical protein MJG53_010594 [Ovis ammon polii x Ovis aries]|uniref:Uncharacterized protein n=1 Tax=Ovis ammon polii x Ovis aries TaxID=2918886 RepID=A0ACB9UU67_9CETA|nr:hypothetical protein MJG53_010594 [Ovis ammon polii x Ovis aries]